jgi:hypothetical protein
LEAGVSILPCCLQAGDGDLLSGLQGHNSFLRGPAGWDAPSDQFLIGSAGEELIPSIEHRPEPGAETALSNPLTCRLGLLRDKIPQYPRDGLELLIPLGNEQLGLGQQPMEFLCRRNRVCWVANPGQNERGNVT